MARHHSPSGDRPESSGAPGRRRFNGRRRPKREEYSVADLLGQNSKDPATPDDRRRVGPALGGLLAVGSLTALAVHVAPAMGLTDGRGAPAGTGADGQRATDPSTPPGTTSAVPPLGALPPLAERPDTRRPFALPNALPPQAPAPYASAPNGTTPGTGTAPRVGDPGLSPVDLLSAPHHPTTLPAVDHDRSPSARSDPSGRAGDPTTGGPTTSAASDGAAPDDNRDDEADTRTGDNRGDGDDGDRGLVGGVVHHVGSSAGTALSSLTAPLG